MGCPSLYVWALVAAAYTTVQSFVFLALNIALILISAGKFNPEDGFFQTISHYLAQDGTVDGTANTTNCTVPDGVVAPNAVAAYQYIFAVLHILWIIAGFIILSQLCRKSRAMRDYLMWTAVASLVILLDTITGIFFIINRVGMETADDDCAKAAFWMLCLSFRGFVIYIVNIACIVVVAVVMRRFKTDIKRPEMNYMDMPSLKKQSQPNKQEHGPPGSKFNKPPAATPPEPDNEIPNDSLNETEQMDNEISQDNAAPIDEVPHTSFQTHSPNERQQQHYLPQQTSVNWDMNQDRYQSDPQSDEGMRYPLDSSQNTQMPPEQPYPFRYHVAEAGRRGHDPRMDEEGQSLERFGPHTERQEDFAIGNHYMYPPQPRHAYDNPAWTGNAPFDEDDPMENFAGPSGVHRPPPREKRNASNRHKRQAPQPKEIIPGDNIEEEEEEKPKPLPKPSLAAPSTFDARPFSYLNPTFRPTDHADVQAMKDHTADIVKTLDLEMKQLKERDMLSEGSDSGIIGIISSPPVRSFLNDSGRRQNVTRSSSLREQLVRSGKVAAAGVPGASFNKPSHSRANPQRDLNVLGSIDESDSPRPYVEQKPPRRHTGDSARPGLRHPNGENARRPREGDEDRKGQKRLPSDRKQDRRHAKRKQEDNMEEDDYDNSDYDEDDDEFIDKCGFGGRSHPQDPVFITAV